MAQSLYRIVTKREFLVLSVILGIEVFIGLGAFFGVQATPESNPDFLPVEVEISPAPEPLPLSVPVPPPAGGPEPERIVLRNVELLPQGQLANPPEIIKAVYLTSWSAGTKGRIDYVIDLASTTKMNAVVIDIKDFSGEVAYQTDVPEVVKYGAQRIKIRDIEAVIRRLHEEGLYVIARITVFQDPVLVAARPDLAVQSIAQEGLWADHKGLGWIDPSALEAWNYTVNIAKDAASRGFDEINFDYVRFPSDGDLADMEFPFWDRQISRQQILRNFFSYLRENLKDVRISADVFGLTTINKDDLGIGQVIEDAYEYFDYVYPMVYPSHYAYGFLGYQKPAQYPYEVVKHSMVNALVRLQALRQAYPEKKFAQLRPWLQDFDLGAKYDTLMVQAQVQATQEAMGEDFKGFLLWAPTNYYTVGALNPFEFSAVEYRTREAIQEQI